MKRVKQFKTYKVRMLVSGENRSHYHYVLGTNQANATANALEAASKLSLQTKKEFRVVSVDESE